MRFGHYPLKSTGMESHDSGGLKSFWVWVPLKLLVLYTPILVAVNYAAKSSTFVGRGWGSANVACGVWAETVWRDTGMEKGQQLPASQRLHVSLMY